MGCGSPALAAADNLALAGWVGRTVAAVELLRIRAGQHSRISQAGIWENKFGLSGKQIRRYFPLHRRLYRSAALCEVHRRPILSTGFPLFCL